jgi:aminoglycoside phosphotransferase (APT) family kinase protein
LCTEVDDLTGSKGPRIAGGRTAEVYLWKDSQILKLFLEGFPARMAEDEARVTGAAYDAGLPVPAVEGVVEIDGRTGIVFERVDGSTIDGPELAIPWTLVRYARICAELHVSVHSCELPEPISQQERLEQDIRRAPGLPADMREAVFKVLQQLPDGNALCHNDFHPGNVMMSSRGPIIIDWMTATRGNPLADVARTSLLLRIGTRAGVGTIERRISNFFGARFYSVYLRKYLKLRPVPHRQISAWLPVMAAARLAEPIPEERQRLLTLIETGLRRQT